MKHTAPKCFEKFSDLLEENRSGNLGSSPFILTQLNYALVAQWIEQLPSKQWVEGSIPSRRASFDQHHRLA